MSDTHGNFYDVPDGDILIHSGDFTNEGIRHGMEDVNDFMSYFKALPHKYKVLVPGNHELGLDRLPVDDLRRMLGCTPGSNIFLLVDESVTIEGIKIYGSPWTQCTMAWPAPSQSQRDERWQCIPKDTDILDGKFYHWGCRALLERIAEVAPAMHCFGHVHDEVGVKPISFHEVEVLFSNAAMDLKKAVNMFTFEAPVGMSSEMVESGEAQISTVGSVGYLQVEGVDLVLDLDAADPQQEMVFLWRKLPGPRPNQLWQLQQMESERYAVRSMCNGQMLRHLSSDFRVSSNSFADQVTWADGLLMSPTGCTVVPPKSWRSGQVLGIAPIDLQEAVKFTFVPVEG
eukprot:Skav213207  [mRNA]  locus=scaffold2826:493165:497976:- [translate_table: standard]